MHTNEPREDPLSELGYETRDLDMKALGKAAAGFFIFAFFCFGVGAVVYHYINPAFSDAYQKQKENLRIPTYPNPLVQTNVTAKTDIMDLRQAETAQLTSTGWDTAHTSLHIPIDRAMSILAQRGLPATGSSVPAISKGNTTDQRRVPDPDMAPPAAESDLTPMRVSPSSSTMISPKMGSTKAP